MRRRQRQNHNQHEHQHQYGNQYRHQVPNDPDVRGLFSTWNRPLRVSVLLGLGLGLALAPTFYLLHGGGIERRRRVELCRSHRYRYPTSSTTPVQLDKNLYRNVDRSFRYSAPPPVGLTTVARTEYILPHDGFDNDHGDDGPYEAPYEDRDDGREDYGGLRFRTTEDGFSSDAGGVTYDGGFWRAFTNATTDDRDDGERKEEDSYFRPAFGSSDDDDDNRDGTSGENGGVDGGDGNCRRVSWFNLHRPTCNLMHEVNVLAGLERYLGYHNQDDINLSVLKVNNHFSSFRRRYYDGVRMDALIMERLTASPRIPDIFGHCGTSVRTEYLPGRIPQCTSDASAPQRPTPVEKLRRALAAAESLAALHGFHGGVIVHNDLGCNQLGLAGPSRADADGGGDGDGGLKLNDFNLARPLSFDDGRGEYCRHRDGLGRSPEETLRRPIDEKAEVWALGNLVYQILTGGHEPFYHVDEPWTIVRRVRRGETAFVDEKYRTGSTAERRLVEVLERCWVYEPEERADVFEVVGMLKDALEESLR